MAESETLRNIFNTSLNDISQSSSDKSDTRMAAWRPEQILRCSKSSVHSKVFIYFSGLFLLKFSVEMFALIIDVVIVVLLRFD